jgi:putative hydroxymethylpyrimidine transport system ATP-binding protein
MTYFQSPPGIVLDSVGFDYEGQPLFAGLDFAIPGGQWTCLLGPSGCGKSTLLRLISGSLESSFSGSIRFDRGHARKNMTAWMAQKDLLLPWLTVRGNALLGPRLRGEVTRERRQRADALLEAAGLKGCLEAYPAALSGGMRQRVALVRTLMENRPVILMDEPFSALDALTRLKLQDLALELLQGATVLLVTHDPYEALRLGHRIQVMSGRPARVRAPLIPPGSPPRRLEDPEVAALHSRLFEQLKGGEH